MQLDVINGAFEAFGGLAILNHAYKLYQDKKLRGVSWWSTAYFTSWGWFNLIFYPSIDQTYSFYGGAFICVTNMLYVGLMLRYRKN